LDPRNVAPAPAACYYEARSFLPGRREAGLREGAVASRGSRESLGYVRSL